MLDSIITSKTRLRLLVKFFINAANRGYMRGLAEEPKESTNAIRKELNSLSEAGYLEKKAARNRVFYRANSQHPLFRSLQDIVHKYLGLDIIVAKVLNQQVVLTGDYTEGRDEGIGSSQDVLSTRVSAPTWCAIYTNLQARYWFPV